MTQPAPAKPLRDAVMDTAAHVTGLASSAAFSTLDWRPWKHFLKGCSVHFPSSAERAGLMRGRGADGGADGGAPTSHTARSQLDRTRGSCAARTRHSIHSHEPIQHSLLALEESSTAQRLAAWIFRGILILSCRKPTPPPRIEDRGPPRENSPQRLTLAPRPLGPLAQMPSTGIVCKWRPTLFTNEPKRRHPCIQV